MSESRLSYLLMMTTVVFLSDFDWETCDSLF